MFSCPLAWRVSVRLRRRGTAGAAEGRGPGASPEPAVTTRCGHISQRTLHGAPSRGHLLSSCPLGVADQYGETDPPAARAAIDTSSAAESPRRLSRPHRRETQSTPQPARNPGRFTVLPTPILTRMGIGVERRRFRAPPFIVVCCVWRDYYEYFMDTICSKCHQIIKK